MQPIISNSVTTQGFENDVESNFTIEQIALQKVTPYQLRTLVSSDAYCEKVVSYLSQAMGNVSYEVKHTANKRSRNITPTISWINDCLKAFIPWFVEAQTQANIVGKAYLIFDVVPDPSIPLELPTPFNYFPLLSPIENYLNLSSQIETLNQSNNIIGVTPLKIVSYGEYGWTSDNKFLISNSQFSGHLEIHNSLDQSKVIKWATDKVSGDINKINDYQHHIIESSHVIEFTAFDYQDDREALNIGNRSLTGQSRGVGVVRQPYVGISFRLIRFLPSLLRYLSFLNATLNRMHRSESIVYKKDNLGETNQMLARQLSQTSIPENQLTPSVIELIQEELKVLRSSLKNFGVAMIDKKNEIDMISRSMAGIDNLDNVFSKDLIAASKLTEYSLFGMNSQGAGLASLDIRDRMAQAKQTDELFANHWLPHLLSLANFLGRASNKVIEGTHNLYIYQSPSFKLTQLESGDWLDKRIKVLIDLKNAGVIDNVIILNELSGNGELGQYFSFTGADVDRLTTNSF